MTYNCPVCNKAGLPDFKIVETSCPQCNANLKAFMVLNSLALPQSQNINKITLLFLVILLSIFGIYIYNSSTTENTLEKKFEIQSIYLKDSIKLYKDSVGALQNHLKDKTSHSSYVIIKYRVKDGDYPAKIAAMFYNDWKMYTEIEAFNNLKKPYILRKGQILRLKITQD